jgi:repressor LexA
MDVFLLWEIVMLTLSQQRTYSFVKSYISDHGYSPTVAEIASGTGLRSRGVIYRYLKALAAAEKIHLVPNRHRNIQLIEEKADNYPFVIPLVGVIAAGLPIEAILQNEQVSVTEALVNKDLFALKVRGSSMIDEGILDGDSVICRPASTANNGDIVVALIDQHEATLKRWYCEGSSVQLIPANSEMKTLNYAAERITIQGVFVGLLRIVN